MRKLKWAMFALHLMSAWAASLMAFNWASVVTDPQRAAWVFLGMSLFNQTMLVLTQAVNEARAREAALRSGSSLD